MLPNLKQPKYVTAEKGEKFIAIYKFNNVLHSIY